MDNKYKELTNINGYLKVHAVVREVSVRGAIGSLVVWGVIVLAVWLFHINNTMDISISYSGS